MSRVVVGMPHPLQHLHGKAISALRQGGANVEVGGQNLLESGSNIRVRPLLGKLLAAFKGEYLVVVAVLNFSQACQMQHLIDGLGTSPVIEVAMCDCAGSSQGVSISERTAPLPGYQPPALLRTEVRHDR